MIHPRAVIAGVVVLGAASVISADSSWSDFVPGSARQYIPEAILEAELPVEVPEFLGIQTKSGSQGMRTLQDAETDLERHTGMLTLTNVVCKKALTLTGTLTATNTHFLSDLSITGPVTLEAKKSMVHGTVSVTGLFWAKGMVFEKDVIVIGVVDATKSSFYETLTVTGTKIKLTKSEVCDLVIKDSGKNPATVILENTTVHGKISFASGQGTVKMYNSSADEAQIIGGNKVLLKR